MQKKLKALVVDDSITIRKIIKANLNKLGVNEVFEAANAEEGFKIAKTTFLDVAFIDYNMPGSMNGLDLAHKIRADQKISSLRLIAVSAEFDEKLVEQFKEAGVKEFIEKPFDLAKFNIAIKPLLEDKESDSTISESGGTKLTKDTLERLFATQPQITVDGNYIVFMFGNEKITMDIETFVAKSFYFLDITSE